MLAPWIDVVDLLLMKERISVFGAFLSYFLATYLFFILLRYLLVEANKGISFESHSTCSLIFPDFNFFSWAVPASMIIFLDSISHDFISKSFP